MKEPEEFSLEETGQGQKMNNFQREELGLFYVVSIRENQSEQ
jgi:hypothetical protein